MPIVETSTDPARPVEVVLMDDGMEVDATVAPEGVVRFAISNRGERAHDLVVAALGEDGGLPVRDGRVHEDAIVVAARIDPLAGGRSHDVVLQLQAGRYMLFSNGKGDFERGLRAELTVQPPEPFDPELHAREVGDRPAA
jgi:hypothetical protein